MSACEISIIGVPMGLGAGRYGAEAGDRAVRTEHLVAALEALGHTVHDGGALAIPPATHPGNPRARFLHEIVDACSRLAHWVDAQLGNGRVPLALGGDHSIALGSVTGSALYARRRGESLGLLWIDAHGDMNTPDTTPSGNIHGMPLAALLGMGIPEMTELGGFLGKVRRENVALVGIRDIDPTEAALIRESGIHAFTIRDIDERGMFAVMKDAIAVATAGTAGFHVSLDMDALDPSIAPGVGTPVPGGLTYREAHLALEMVADTERLRSIDVVEVNPMLDAQNLTARMAVGLVTSAFGKRILPPSPRRQI
jgi:arginase